MITTLNKRQNIGIVIVLTAAILGGLGVWYWKVNQPSQTTSPAQPPQTEEKEFEIVKTSDGRKILVAHKFDFKVAIPKGWYFSSGGGGPNAIGLEKPDGTWVNITTGEPRDQAKFPTLRDIVVSHYPDAEVPEEPNLEIAGFPAFQYRFPGFPDVKEAVIVEFETRDHFYQIYTLWKDRDEPGYQTILESFEILK